MTKPCSQVLRRRAATLWRNDAPFIVQIEVKSGMFAAILRDIPMGTPAPPGSLLRSGPRSSSFRSSTSPTKEASSRGGPLDQTSFAVCTALAPAQLNPPLLKRIWTRHGACCAEWQGYPADACPPYAPARWILPGTNENHKNTNKTWPVRAARAAELVLFRLVLLALLALLFLLPQWQRQWRSRKHMEKPPASTARRACLSDFGPKTGRLTGDACAKRTHLLGYAFQGCNKGACRS